ncbi:MAG: hypothetical protein R3A44_12740 [Caldilineaceae bacterium]
MITIHEVVRRCWQQHHAIEHATIHLLNERYPNRRVGGWRRDGLYRMGNVHAEESAASGG